jgi:tetratricopeptide (TPR) repeat protein
MSRGSHRDGTDCEEGMGRDRISEDAQALFERGQQAYHQGDHREAVECLSRAIRLRPDVAVAYRYRAYAYRELGDRLNALNDLDTAIRLKPDDVQAYADRATELFAQKSFEQAISDCNQVLALDPGRGAIYGLRGRCHAELGNSEQALEDFKQAIHADPANAVQYLQWRAELHLECGHWNDVLADCEAICRHDPQHVMAYYLRGVALAETGQNTEAINAFSTALQIQPTHIPSLLGRARVYLQLGWSQQAEADCTRILTQEPSATIAYELRGLARRLQGRWREAAEDFTQALQLDPSVDLYNARAEMRYYAGDYAAAISDHIEALKLDPHNPDTFNCLAWIWSTCPDPEFRNGQRAKDCATRACELSEWSEPIYLDTLAAAYAECGDYDQALQWVNRAIELLEQKQSAPTEVRHDYAQRRELYRNHKPFRTASGPLATFPIWGAGTTLPPQSPES